LRLRAQAAIAEAGGAVAAGAFDAATRCGALQAAAGAGRPAALEALLAAGAPVDAPDGNGLTALQARGAGGAGPPGLLSWSWSLSWSCARSLSAAGMPGGVLENSAVRGRALTPGPCSSRAGRAGAPHRPGWRHAGRPATPVRACRRRGTHAARRAGLTPGRCARAQVARRYEQCDAEGVLLRAGARDPDDGAPAARAAGGWGRAGAAGAPRRRPAAREARAAREAAAGAGDGARAEPGGAAAPPAAQAGPTALGEDRSAAGAPPPMLPRTLHAACSAYHRLHCAALPSAALHGTEVHACRCCSPRPPCQGQHERESRMWPAPYRGAVLCAAGSRSAAAATAGAGSAGSKGTAAPGRDWDWAATVLHPDRWSSGHWLAASCAVGAAAGLVLYMMREQPRRV